MQITSKYAGRCKVCGATIRVGQRINWTKTDGASCLDRNACLIRYKAAQNDCPPPEVDECPPEYADCPPPEVAEFVPSMVEDCPPPEVEEPALDDLPF